VLLELISERGKFRCGVFTKHVLRQLARRRRSSLQETDDRTLKKIGLEKSIWRIEI
jgi:hypothetical protein